MHHLSLSLNNTAWYAPVLGSAAMLDMDSKTLHHLRTDAVCHLPPAEAALLHMLLLGNGRIVDFETLSCAISPEHDGAGIRTRISSLRKRLSNLEGARCVIEAVRNHGYRIVL
jgi:DNA-binding response OmpR family regulator